MKQYLAIVVSLTLITNSNCGLIDGLFGTIKDTTSSITHGVGSALHYGKNFVFGGTEHNAAGQDVTKPGIVGTIPLKIHDVPQTVREQVQTVIHVFDEDQVHGKGITGSLFDRVKCHVFKIKSFLFNHGQPLIENGPYAPIKKLNNETVFIQHHLNKYFFSKDALAPSGIRQTLNSLQEAINRIRLNITKKIQESENVNSDGTGLIDIRTSVNNLGGSLQNDFENGVDAAYDKVNDAVDKGQQTAQSSFNGAKQNTNDFIENQRRNVQNHYSQFGDVNKFRSDVGSSISDNIENQRRNVQNHYNEMANNADKLRSDVVQSIDYNIENQRRNVQGHYNQMDTNADRLRSEVGSSISENIENQRRNLHNHYNEMTSTADRLRSDAGNSINDNFENQRRYVQVHNNQMANNADRLRSDVGSSISDNIENQRRNVQNHYNEMANNADRLRSDAGSSIHDNFENQRRYVQGHYNQMANNADRLRTDVGSSISDIGVRLGDESSKVKDLMDNAYRST